MRENRQITRSNKYNEAIGKYETPHCKSHLSKHCLEFAHSTVAVRDFFNDTPDYLALANFVKIMVENLKKSKISQVIVARFT